MLKRLLIPLALLLCSGAGASAQLLYAFKDTTTPYVPLGSGAASLTGTDPWDAFSKNYVAPMPFSWRMDSSFTLTGLPLFMGLPATCTDTGDYSDVNGFMFADFTELTDRGILGSTSLSPIRYTTTGTAPARVFKLEFFNAGFAYELYDFSTLDDSINVQIWIYEGSGIVELHYGPSRITNPGDYFATGANQPIIGYLKHLDLLAGTSGTIHYIADNGAGGTKMDSIALTASAPPSNALNGWPASGRVFRFTPRRPACSPPVSSFTAAAPLGQTISFTYTGTATGLDSLVWNFGDGVKQKVTAAYTTPIAHTYASTGHYNITVTAYSSCGSATSNSGQSAVSVGSIANLRGVKAYPNPASNVLTVEGLANGSASILSLTGQVLLRATLSTSREAISITALPAGTYNLLLQGDDGATGAMPFSKL